MFSDSMMLGGGRKAAFSIANSVRMDGVADYFSRTPSVAGNRNTFTFSGWVKRSSLGKQYIFGIDNYACQIGFDGGDELLIQMCNDTNTTSYPSNSAAVFRDTTSWYHLVMSVDTTAATGSRVKGYVNGVQVLGQGMGVYNEPPFGARQNIDSTLTHVIGRYTAGYYYVNGYMAEFHFVDDAALEPSHFGEVDPITGSWRPKKVNISDYGTNGFHLDFNDVANLGNDVSGRGNHWIPVSLGAADVVADTPTNNYALPNRLDGHSAISLSDGNRLVTSSTGVALVRMSAAIPAVGDWVVEMTHKGGTSPMVGVESGGALPHLSNSSVLYRALNGNKYVDGLDSGVYGASYVENDVIGIVCNANTVTFYKNGVGQGTIAHGLSGDIFFACGGDANSYILVNSGQTAFSYSYGSAKALCTANLPKPAIPSPAKHFDVVTYTGTGMPQSITGLGFQPDFVWGKSRNMAGYSHHLQDVVRGWGNDLYSDLTSAEVNRPQLITSVSPTGFTLGTDEGMNESGGTYVAWCWKAGGAPVINTDGTITSQVSANPAAGFSIVSYTGTLSPATIGHGLGVSPKLIIVKSLTVGTYDWTCQHVSLGPDKRIWLNLTSAADSLSNPWNGTAATDTVFSVGTNNETNFADRMIAYCWAEIPGFSKFGSYTGNGSADGPFVHCGFRPRWIMVKDYVNGDSSGAWWLYDTSRGPVNPVAAPLSANSATTEWTSTDIYIDVTSNGFKLRGDHSGTNSGSRSYIFAAFAEAPFGGAKTVPAKAR